METFLRTHRQRAKPELHLFIIWEKATHARPRILRDLCSHFTMLRAFEVEWSKELFGRNLTLFYSTILPSGSDKEKHCGSGPFTVFVVLDPAPHYARRWTSQGPRLVNTNVFDAKARYRKWTGGGHRIHSTISRDEVEHDLFMLLGTTPQAFLHSHPSSWEGAILPQKRDLPGAKGWESWETLFRVLNWSLIYVSLDGAPVSPSSVGGPIHLLVDHYSFACRFLGTLPRKRLDEVHEAVLISGRPATIILRSIGDGHMNERWQRALLRNRVLSAHGIYVLPPADKFYVRLHEALIHDNAITHREERKLLTQAEHLGLCLSSEDIQAPSTRLAEMLDQYVARQRHHQPEPFNSSISPDHNIVPRSISSLKHIMRAVRNLTIKAALCLQLRCKIAATRRRP